MGDNIQNIKSFFFIIVYLVYNKLFKFLYICDMPVFFSSSS